MKAAIIRQKNDLVIQEIPDLPPVSDYQCSCQNIFFSACSSTDMKLISDEIPWGVSYPAVLGHETVGEVIDTGSKVRNFRKGDIVLRPVYGYAGQQVNGLNNEFGGFSEYGIITDFKAMQADGVEGYSAYSVFQMKIPETWKTKPESVILITMKETFSWIRQLAPLYGKKVGVIGVGPVGMFFIRFASLMFAKSVTAIARTAAGRERAMKCGADSFVALNDGEEPQEKFDVLIDAAGVNDINQFLPYMAAGGTFAVYGVPHNMETHIKGFGSGVVFSFHSPAESNQLVHDTCVSMFNKGIIDLKEFHSSIFPFEKLSEAFEKIKRKEEFKPVFQF